MTTEQPGSDRPAVERFGERIDDLADRATEDCAAFEPPASPPDEQRAMSYLRTGAGPAISLYIEARTGGQMVQFPPDQYRALEGAMNDWLGLYAACYGVEMSPEFALREAAELLLDTHNIGDVAQLLTGVPERS
ncbi:hypothetical protein GRX03_02670 [Halovenus sp. WSH3]|uniref:DUF8055 domain-containing protein n=1 Tax=Halovenus carboxidivorans TaxID=2692199 RepID=A0A6B0T5K4_9EURY|nr:hypothetical protein [Halovenus carboxidivorans]MXR50511.1 hypothetical protein [Halovenus carboxidivorans]